MGEGLPARALGFSTLEAFLSSIPDVCTIQWRGANLTVLGVASQGTAHIQVHLDGQPFLFLNCQVVQDMIDRQSNKKGGGGGKKSGGRRFGSGGGGGGRSYGGGGRSMRRGWDWGGDDDDYSDPYQTSNFDIIGGFESCKVVPEPCYPL